jgi:serine/threonine protein kinase
MALTIDEFVSVARESRLVKPDLLDSMLGEVRAVGSTHDTHALASRLVGHGMLTHWQSEKLLSGVSSGFFLGKYKLQRLIASGSMSSVYEADHILLNKRFALKVLPKALVEEASFLERFYREARAVVRLDHPNIIRGFDVGQEGDYHYFVMEYLEGSSFQDHVEKMGPMAPDLAAGLIRQAALGLEHAHQAGMIHRDIKPANLLLASDGVVKVLDLGLVRSLPQETDGEAGLTRVHDERMLGTVDYLSPEQAIDSHNVDIRSDIYSLGCTFYFLLTGDPPFAKGTLTERLLAHQTRSAIPISVIRPDVPASLGRIISKMLEKRSDNRYQSPAEVARALEEWLHAFNEPKPNDSSEVSMAIPWFNSSQRDSLPAYEPVAAGHSSISRSDTQISSLSSTSRSSTIRSGSTASRPSSSIINGRRAEPSTIESPSVILGRDLWQPWGEWVQAVEALGSNSGLRFTPNEESYRKIYDELMLACRSNARDSDETINRIVREIQDITAPWMSLQTLRSIVQSEMRSSILDRVRQLDKFIKASQDAVEKPGSSLQTFAKVLFFVAAALVIGAATLILGPDPSETEQPPSWISQTRLTLKKHFFSMSEKIASH